MMETIPGIASRPILRYGTEPPISKDDSLAIEEPLEITLSVQGARHTVAITMRTPGNDHDLALGFLFTEGILPAGTQVQWKDAGGNDARNRVLLALPSEVRPDLRRLERHSYTSSSCGVCGKTSLEMVYAALPFAESPGQWTVSPTLLQSLPDKLRQQQRLFEQTGGIHAAGIFDASGQLLHLAEDVGRHNALDKVIGHAFQQDLLPLDDCILVLSGRSSFELIQKAAMAGIRFVIAVGAPSSLAVDLAQEQGMTLCGFVRPGGFNCYAGAGRIFTVGGASAPGNGL